MSMGGGEGVWVEWTNLRGARLPCFWRLVRRDNSVSGVAGDDELLVSGAS